jgi:hypothetical protein
MKLDLLEALGLLLKFGIEAIPLFVQLKEKFSKGEMTPAEVRTALAPYLSDLDRQALEAVLRPSTLVTLETNFANVIGPDV